MKFVLKERMPQINVLVVNSQTRVPSDNVTRKKFTEEEKREFLRKERRKVYIYEHWPETPYELN